MWELYLLAVSPATSTGPNMSKSEAAPRSLAHFLHQVINSMLMHIRIHQGLLFMQPLEEVSQEEPGLCQGPRQDPHLLRPHSMCNFLNTRVSTIAQCHGAAAFKFWCIHWSLQSVLQMYSKWKLQEICISMGKRSGRKDKMVGYNTCGNTFPSNEFVLLIEWE